MKRIAKKTLLGIAVEKMADVHGLLDAELLFETEKASGERDWHKVNALSDVVTALDKAIRFFTRGPQ